MRKNKKALAVGLVDGISVLVWIVIVLVFAVLIGVATYCSKQQAESIAGTDIREAFFGYQLNSYLRIPMELNVSGETAEATMADAITYAVYLEEQGKSSEDAYAQISYYSSEILKNVYGGVCAAVRIELRNADGKVEETEDLGKCPNAEIREEAEIPYLATKKTIAVQLRIGGDTYIDYKLCDRGSPILSPDERYYCEEFSGIGSCGFMFWGDTTIASYDKKSICQRNLELVKAGKPPEVLKWALCRKGDEYLCHHFDKSNDRCGSSDFKHVTSFATEAECESSRPK